MKRMKENDGLYRDNFTVRDHFAGRVMQSTIAGLIAKTGESTPINRMIAAIEGDAKDIAATSYKIADAMLAERKKP
jgi:hypothetical protein